MKIWMFIFVCFFGIAFPFTHYPLLPDPIDVIIPCHPKDQKTLDLCIEGIRKNGKKVRRVIVISQKKLTDKAEWFAEKLFPFSLEEVKKELFLEAPLTPSLDSPRIGWLFQQLLKLYAFKIIPGLSSNLLVLDADTIFLQPVHFFSAQGEPYFTLGKQLHPPYLEHMKRLLPDIPLQEVSAICHHMIFQRPILEDLFAEIEKVHQKEVWKAICHCVGKNDILAAGFSEYETYFAFTVARTKQAHTRKLKWKNTKSLEKLPKYQRRKYDYISCHTRG